MAKEVESAAEERRGRRTKIQGRSVGTNVHMFSFEQVLWVCSLVRNMYVASYAVRM